MCPIFFGEGSGVTRELLGTLVKCMGTHIKQPNNIL
jgi:hypothetical protein